MKQLVTLAMMLTGFVASAQDEMKETFNIIGGPTVQFFDGSSKRTGLGYYFGIKPEVPLRSWVSVGSHIFFMQQFCKDKDVSIRNSSANASFYLALKPVKQVSLIGGYVGGINASMMVNNERAEGLPKERISWMAGTSVSIGEQMSIDATYVHPKNAQIFERTIMIGISFKI